MKNTNTTAETAANLTETIQQEHDRMRQRAAEYANDKDGTGVVMAEAFVRGMRDIGYKSTAYALNEIIDNALEARASQVLVELFEGKGGLESVAIIDNGMGMPEEWIRHSIRWGGSHRDQGNLKGLGRFGYGLKSAAISFARRFEVYSKIENASNWSMVYLDVDDLAKGNYRTESGGVGVPAPSATGLPQQIHERLKERGISLEHGTVILITKIDSDRIRTRYNMTGSSDVQKIESFLMEQFGITFRNYVLNTPVLVNGKKVDPIDPLFITPGTRFYDIDKDRATPLSPMVIPVKSQDKKTIQGYIRCRFSWMPATFLRKAEYKLVPNSGPRTMNERFAIRRDNNGVIVLRAGRQIDVIDGHTEIGKFQNNDRYIGLEIDFDPTLDGLFAVPTSKQQVVPSKRVWDLLDEAGFKDALAQMRALVKKDIKRVDELASKKSSPDQKPADDDEMTPAEAAMKSVEKFLPPKKETLEEIKRAEEELETKLEEESSQTGIPKEKLREVKEEQAKIRPYRITLENKGDVAPFFRAVQEGGQKVLYINRDHRFYMDIYSHTDGIVRNGLEAMLFSIGALMIRSSGDMRTFYETSLVNWSVSLNAALSNLEEYDASMDNRQAEEQVQELAAND
jgi:hypothetical protein